MPVRGVWKHLPCFGSVRIGSSVPRQADTWKVGNRNSAKITDAGENVGEYWHLWVTLGASKSRQYLLCHAVLLQLFRTI